MIFDYWDEKETCREEMQPTYDVWGTVLAASENTSKGSVRVQVKNMRDHMDTFDDVPVLTCYGGSGYGAFFLPEEGDVVRLTFLGGDFRHPVVTGCRFPESSQFVKEVFDDQNLKKEWKLKSGSRIAFSGEKGKERIEISGPEKLEWVLDEEAGQIVYGNKDKEKKNRVLLDGGAGKALVTSEQSIRLECGESSLELKKDGTVVLQCKQLTLEAAKVEIKGKSSVQIKGQELGLAGSGNVTLSGKGQTKVESKGPLKLSGAMIHLN